MKFWLLVAMAAVGVVAASCDSPASKPPAGGESNANTETGTVSTALNPPAPSPAANEPMAPMMMSTSAPAAGTGPATTMPVQAAAQTVVTTQPMIGTKMSTTLPSLDLAAAFVSPIDGFEFRPPIAGIRRYQLGTGEIVGFSYPDKGWDIRVKPVPLPHPMPLKELLLLTASQLAARDESAEIVKQQVMPFGNDSLSGLLEARYSQGIDRVFGQEVLIPQGLTSYLMVQMVSPSGRTEDDKIKEAEARRVFHEVLETFHLIDRAEVRKDQDRRFLATEHFYQKLDENRIKQACVPQQYMRVVRDKKDIGFMCVYERPADKDGSHGVQVVVCSYMRIPAEPTTRPAGETPFPVPVNRDGGGADGNPQRIVVPDFVGSGPTAAGARPPKQDVPTNVNAMSDFFLTLDRDHESWTAWIKPGDSAPLFELGSSDLTTRRALDRAKWQKMAPVEKGDGQPPIKIITERWLSVTPAVGKSINEQVPWFCYLPQGLGQLLPRLIANEPGKYLFVSYVSDTQKAMLRYVDVDAPTEVTLGGVTQPAIPVSDRIGVEGIATTHYVTAQGQWIGSINNQTGMEVLPSTPGELKGIWNGFKEYPDPPRPKDTPKGAPGTIPAAKHSVLENL